jgi:hypothetical protein
MRTLTLLALAVALTTTSAGCGGGGGGSSGPLSRRFDDMYVASVAMDQKAEMLAAQNDWSRARMEADQSDSDLREAGTFIQVAKNDEKGAKLKEDSAKAEKKQAETSGDTNKINEAMRSQRAAEKARQAAQARVKYLEAYREFLQAQLKARQEHALWREAQYELAKAKVARNNNISPKGFVYEDYVKQEQNKSSKASSARGKVDSARGKATDRRNAWTRVQDEADTMNGSKNTHPDPLVKHLGAASAQ